MPLLKNKRKKMTKLLERNQRLSMKIDEREEAREKNKKPSERKKKRNVRSERKKSASERRRKKPKRSKKNVCTVPKERCIAFILTRRYS